MPPRGPGKTIATQARSVATRLAVIALLLLVYSQVFESVFHRIAGAAFFLVLIPCVAGGALLGIWGGLLTVVVSILLDAYLATSVGSSVPADTSTIVVSVFTKLVLGIASGLVAQSARRLRLLNAQLTEEVSRRRRSEQMLEGSERLYRALVESLGEGVGLFNADDVCVFANPALCSALDKSREDIVGTKFAIHLDEVGQQRVAQSHYEGSVRSPAYEVSLSNRETSVLLVTETRLVDREQPTGNKETQTLRVVRDLSSRISAERKQRELERQLQKGQALQSLAVLAGGVAHDFNNLLSGIVGNAEFALLRIPREASIELTQCIEEIREFASEAGQLSRQMLAYAGRRSLAVGAVDVNVEVREALRLLHSTIEAKSLLRLNLADGLPLVKADRLQLRQVLTNLVLNALEAMSPNRGTLTIRTSCDALDETELRALSAPVDSIPGAYVAVTVSDNGIGIPPELKDRIFEPFFSTKAPGRGMGLAASVGIVRAHRGMFDVSSEPGAGTTIRVLLPFTQESDRPIDRLTPTEILPTRPRNILLIDDEVAVRVVTNRLLTELGQKVIVASSGQQGLELFRQHKDHIDLVLLDLTMPELSGAEVLTELRRLNKDVSVIVTSGFHPSDATDLLDAPNVIGFLEKPHTLANLQAIVATISNN